MTYGMTVHTACTLYNKRLPVISTSDTIHNIAVDYSIYAQYDPLMYSRISLHDQFDQQSDIASDGLMDSTRFG